MTAIRCKVLLVDDDGMLLGALARQLSAAFDVTTASTLGEARAALVQSMPDVLVTDLDLGGGERGEDLLQFVATFHPAVARVAFAGSPDALAAVGASGLAQVLQEKGALNADALLRAVRLLCPGVAP